MRAESAKTGFHGLSRSDEEFVAGRSFGLIYCGDLVMIVPSTVSIKSFTKYDISLNVFSLVRVAKIATNSIARIIFRSCGSCMVDLSPSSTYIGRFLASCKASLCQSIFISGSAKMRSRRQDLW